MFITKKHLSRRTFLRGAGVTIALPLLESMVPAQTPLARTAAAPTQRFGFVYVPHGSIMKDWTPAKDGAGFEFSPILKPLEKFRDQVNVITGLYNSGEPGHSVSCATFLSGTVPSKGNVIHLNTTIDQIIARRRAGLDIPLDGVCDRRSLQPYRQLCRRFPLFIHEYDFVAHADAAAAHGTESPRRLRAHVRR
jgi:hypothetical protein